MVGAVLLQILLGIATLLSGVELPLAVAHQAMAALLLAAVVVTSHELGCKRSHERDRERLRDFPGLG
jgi:cytochrome c oxidase assembly protein subunit 15